MEWHLERLLLQLTKCSKVKLRYLDYICLAVLQDWGHSSNVLLPQFSVSVGVNSS